VRLALALAFALLTGCAHTEVKEDPKPADPKPADPAQGDPKPEATPLAGMVLPPATAGEFRTAVAGCAATPDKEPPASRAMPSEEKVEASGIATGLVLTHEVPHACCLAAATTVDVAGDKVTVTDTLSGTACRCMCSSSLRTAVGLKPGSYSVEVKTVVPGKTHSAWSGTVVVK
jgi:hypothetical protein